MLTKTKTYWEIDRNDLEINHSFTIPENIQNTINDRWFYMYQWIWANDVKASIERDFLKYIEKYWTIIAVLFVIPCALLFFAWNTILFIFFVIWFLLIINFIFIFILWILAIKRSSILRKNAYVLLTDSSVSLNWKIEKFKNNKLINWDNKIQEITNLFEEEIFKESNIEKTKKWFLKQVMDSFWKWYSTIFRLWKNSNSKNSWQLILVLIALYTVYALSLGIIYFFWIFFIWIFWIILNIINKKILLISGHKITSINQNFEYIDEYSNKLIIEKDNLWIQLKEAINNDWKDWLLTKINSWLENINKYADNSIKTNLKLKQEIIDSQYKDMFNFSIYNWWIKKQILTPLVQIFELLEKNLNILNENKISITRQIKDTTDPSLSGPLVASKTRIEMKIEELEKHKSMIKIYIDKLK